MSASEAIPLNHSRQGDPEYCCTGGKHNFHFRPGAPKIPRHLIWCCCKSTLSTIEPEPPTPSAPGEVMPDPILAAPSSEPGREDFRTALTHLIATFALDVQAGCTAEEVALVMDEARIKYDKETRDA